MSLNTDIKKILFISFDHIGDILRFTPLLRTLRSAYPAAYIAVLAPQPQSEILKHYPYINDIIEYPHFKLRAQLEDGVNFAELVYTYVYILIAMLRGMHFDLVINPFMEFGAVIAGMIRPKQVLGRVMTKWGTYKLFGKHAAMFYYLMSRQNKLRVLSKTRFSDAALTILRDLGISEESFFRKPELFLSIFERDFADRFVHDHGITADDTLIGFQVGAMLRKERFWPAHKFAELANTFENHKHIKIILFGSPPERELIDQKIIPLLRKQCIIAAGETTVLQSAALIEKIDLLVSNDTGPMHMAASLGVPVIALFGRATCIVEEARPYGDDHTVIVEQNTKDISVDRVFDAVKKYIDKGAIRKEVEI